MKTEMPILKMLPNRVRRNYLGGAVISSLRGFPPEDGDKPEEWLCSTVEAKNPGLEPVQNEGLSETEINGRKYIFAEILKENPEYYLNSSSYHSLSFLAKWLDSSIRLHMQAHPTKDFSKKYLGCDYGKFEAYYVLGIREDVKEPYIRLGFQRKDITKEIWKKSVNDKFTFLIFFVIFLCSACFKVSPAILVILAILTGIARQFILNRKKKEAEE